MEFINLIESRNQLERELKNLIYGNVEIREKEGKKYIYVHFREEGLPRTKYVGEYSDELYNLILNNSLKAKEIKKELRKINKELQAVGYVESDIDDNVKANIDFARRHLVETIYNQAILEGVATTYAETEAIIEGGKVRNMSTDDIMKVVNLKHAWEFILNKDVLNSPTNFYLLCDINRFIEEGFYYNAGRVRSTPVSIGGTTWKPELPIESVIKERLQEILDSDTEIVDKAIELLLFVMKKQIFIDGNKRTAVVFANHLLIKNALGILVIPSDMTEKYKKLLIAFYEGRDERSIREFLKKYAYKKI